MNIFSVISGVSHLSEALPAFIYTISRAQSDVSVRLVLLKAPALLGVIRTVSIASRNVQNSATALEKDKNFFSKVSEASRLIGYIKTLQYAMKNGLVNVSVTQELLRDVTLQEYIAEPTANWAEVLSAISLL